MDDHRSSPWPSRVAWAFIVLALGIAFVAWGTQIGSSLDSPIPRAVLPTPLATDAPGIVTVNTNLAPFNTSTLCAQISPPTTRITIESTSGVVISTVDC